MPERFNIIEGRNRAPLKVWVARIGAGVIALGGLVVLGDAVSNAGTENAKLNQQAAVTYPMPTDHIPTAQEVEKINNARFALVGQLQSQDVALGNNYIEGAAGLMGSVIGGIAFIGIEAERKRRHRPFLR
jgi:hypothetical protein